MKNKKQLKEQEIQELINKILEEELALLEEEKKLQHVDEGIRDKIRKAKEKAKKGVLDLFDTPDDDVAFSDIDNKDTSSKSKDEEPSEEEPNDSKPEFAKFDSFDDIKSPKFLYIISDIDKEGGKYEYTLYNLNSRKTVKKFVSFEEFENYVDDGKLEQITDEASRNFLEKFYGAGKESEKEGPQDSPSEPASDNPTAPMSADPQDVEDAAEEIEDAPKEKGATFWEKMKYGLSKLGTYKVNGRLFIGRNKAKKETIEKVKAALEKASDDRVKNLDVTIKEKDPKFPNSLKQEDFLNSVVSIATLYDSIVSAVQKEGEGSLPPDAANELINALREYVKKALDTDLAAVYSTLDENKEEEPNELDEDAAADVRAKLAQDRKNRAAGGEDDSDFSSTRIDTLKSNKLPIALTALGSSLGAFSWIVNTEWFKNLFTTLTPSNYEEKIKVASKQINPIKKGEGVYRLLSRLTGINLDANQSPEKFVSALKQIGAGDAEKGAEQLCQKGGVMMKPEQALSKLKELLANPNKYDNLGQYFRGEAIGTGKTSPVDTTLFGTIEGKKLESLILSTITKVVTKTTATTSAGYGILKGLGPVALPLGISLVAAGAAVKLMRMKGLKSSRAATLNALYQSLRNVPKGVIVKPEGEVDDKINVPTPEVDEKPGETSGKDAKPTGGSEKGTNIGGPKPEKEKKDKGEKSGKGPDKATDDDDLYNTLKQLFRVVVNNRRSLGVRSKDNVGTVPAKETEIIKNKGIEAEKESPVETPPPGTEYEYTVTRDKKKVPMKLVVGDVDAEGKYTVTATNKSTKKSKTYKTSKENLLKLAKKHNKVKTSIKEAKYVKDEDVKKYLKKALSFNKLESFDELMTKVEAARNKIRNARPKQKDTTFNKLIAEFDKNPIMLTNISDLFEVDSKNKKELASLKSFIDDLFISIYPSRIKKGRENVVDKMASAGGGNLNALLEAYYGADDPNDSFLKDAQSRERFKNNLIKFLTDAINLFQHLYSKKRNK